MKSVKDRLTSFLRLLLLFIVTFSHFVHVKSGSLCFFFGFNLLLIFLHSFFKFSFCPDKTGFCSFFCDFYKFFTAPPDSYFLLPCYLFYKSFASHIFFAVAGKNRKNLSRNPLWTPFFYLLSCQVCLFASRILNVLLIVHFADFISGLYRIIAEKT